MWDRFYRHINDLKDATAESGLTVIRLEMAAVLALRKGPWNKDAHHAAMLASAREMFKELGCDSLLFNYFYDDICQDLQESAPDVGTPGRYERPWERCKALLRSASKGHAAKVSRWWTIEVTGREQRPLRSMTLMLLVWIGFRRRWWTTFDESPLCDATQPLKEMDGDPAPEGLEALSLEDLTLQLTPPHFNSCLPKCVGGLLNVVLILCSMGVSCRAGLGGHGCCLPLWSSGLFCQWLVQFCPSLF